MIEIFNISFYNKNTIWRIFFHDKQCHPSFLFSINSYQTTNKNKEKKTNQSINQTNIYTTYKHIIRIFFVFKFILKNNLL